MAISTESALSTRTTTGPRCSVHHRTRRCDVSTVNGAPRLLARGIVKTFGAHRALKGVDLTVGDGEVVGLIGENGAGKSTILNIVSGVLPFDSGTLQLDGRDIAPKS